MTDKTEDGDGRRTLQGYLASVGSAAGYGFGTYFAYLVIRDGVPPMTATFFSLAFGLLLMAILFPRPALVDLKLASLRGWVVVSMSGLASVFGVTSFYLSLDRVSVVIASPVAGANPLVAILMTHIFLQRLERVSFRTVIGAVLVVAGVALVTIGTA
ncbi:MAG: EamA family transporter [Chloroflexi bacterium]|nr:EamA family transporter [Chloroflexota bacterium]